LDRTKQIRVEDRQAKKIDKKENRRKRYDNDFRGSSIIHTNERKRGRTE